jgi:hypothetical protein
LLIISIKKNNKEKEEEEEIVKEDSRFLLLFCSIVKNSYKIEIKIVLNVVKYVVDDNCE